MTIRDFQQRIQDHYEDPYHRGRCESPSHYAESSNNQCDELEEDIIAVELRVSEEVGDEQIEELWFDGRGCQKSQAVASMLAEQLEGMRTKSVSEMSFDQIRETLGIEFDPVQQNCCRVAFDAVQDALNSPRKEDLDGPTFGGPDLGDEC